MAELKPEPSPMNIATISAGFEKGDFLVREEQGNRVYFDFFEEVRKLPPLLLFCEIFSLHVRGILTLGLCYSDYRHSTTSPIKGTPVCHEKTKSTGST